MALVVLAVVVSVAWVTGATALGWWASGSWFPGLLLGAFTAYVAFGLMVPLALTWADAGSIRQAKRSLDAARNDGRTVAVVRARLQLYIARWQRPGPRRRG